MAAKIALKIPFSYSVKHILPRKRNADTFYIVEEASVVLENPSPEEAPVALRYAVDRHDDKKPVDHLHWEGRFWSPYRDTSGGNKSHMTLDGMVAKLGHRNGSHYVPFSMISDRSRDRAVPLASMPPGRTTDSGDAEREKALATLAEQAAKTIVVGGKLYQPSPEPIYHLQSLHHPFGRWRDPKELMWYVDVIGADAINTYTDPELFFRADRLDDALAELVRRAKLPRISKAKMAGAVWGKVEVVLPETLKFSYDMRPRTDEAIESVLKDMAPHLPKASVAFMTAFAGVRDLAAEKPRDHDAIVAAVRDEVMPLLDPEGFEHTLERARGMVSDWNGRADMAVVRDEEIDAFALAP